MYTTDPLQNISPARVLLQVNKQLGELGLPEEIAEKVWEAISVDSLEGLDALLGVGHPSADELRRLWALAEGYGYQQWLQLDLGIVRGLAYYTGGLFSVPVLCGGIQSAAEELTAFGLWLWPPEVAAAGPGHCAGRSLRYRWLDLA